MRTIGVCLLVIYSLYFILIVVLGLCTQINKTYDFVYFQNKNTITYTPNLTVFQPIEKWSGESY